MISAVSVMRILAFCLTFLLGVAAHSSLQNNTDPTPIEAKSVGPEYSGSGFSGPGEVGVNKTDQVPAFARPGTKELRIISKPRPAYTTQAREDNVQGTVLLRVTFLASGKIGTVSVVKELSDGLTEQAMSAAERIQFEPRMLDGVPVSVTKQVEYTFSIY